MWRRDDGEDDGTDDYPGEYTGVFPDPLLAQAPVEDQTHVIAGRYEIVQRIGAGGMGQVLHVRHLRLGKSFALKLMNAELSLDPQLNHIFHQEARLASGLSHPNIVSVVDFGEDPDWGLFIVMEFIEGESLADRMNSGPLSAQVVCDVASQLVDALHHSHSRNVVHGDLKPDNILCVTPEIDERRRWHVKLLDYGMARPISHSGGREDVIAGTPEYMAPERITGGALMPAADIYALGVLMFEMLAGKVPFSGDNATEILHRHLSDAPPSMSDLRGEPIDPRLTSIVSRALAKRPSDRYRDVSEIGRELRSFMNSLGLATRSGSSRPAGDPMADRGAAAADAFDALGIPAAGIDADGTIVIANQRFCRLLREEHPEQLEGTSIFATSLGRTSPSLRDDLRVVTMTGALVRRRLVLGQGAQAATLRVLMSPGREHCGSCVIVLHPLRTSS